MPCVIALGSGAHLIIMNNEAEASVAALVLMDPNLVSAATPADHGVIELVRA